MTFDTNTVTRSTTMHFYTIMSLSILEMQDGNSVAISCAQDQGIRREAARVAFREC